MANNFPVLPADYAISQLTYSAILPTPVVQTGSALDYGAGVQTSLNYPVTMFGVSFTFATPGDTGTFDQATFEAEFAALVDGVCNGMANMSGLTLAAVKSQVVITRDWSWTSTTTGASAAFTDHMTYPFP